MSLRSLDGQSLVPVMNSNGADREEIILYRNYEDLYAAVITDDWKLIASVAGNHQLFHLSDDPGEKTNLTDQYPEKREHLLRVLQRWKETMGIVTGQ